jgi:DNA/RNA-binding domain of Phe-tRNA-synthetase-like protein
MSLTVAPEVQSIVHAAWWVSGALIVVDRDPRLDAPLAAAAAAMRSTDGRAEVTAAVRALYRRIGIDPTKTRPSSEALLRRVRKGDELPRINNLVDIINWCSLEAQLPFGLYDTRRIRGEVTLRIGRPGEQYGGIRKDVVRVADRLTLADADGPFGNPTSDSARTMVTSDTRAALVVVFGPGTLPAAVVDRALVMTRERVVRYCAQPGDRIEGSCPSE